MKTDQPVNLIPIEVVGYSGYKADERPLKVVVGGVCLEVVEVVDRWYGETFDYFKVALDNGERHLLARHRVEDCWYLVRGGTRPGASRH